MTTLDSVRSTAGTLAEATATIAATIGRLREQIAALHRELKHQRVAPIPIAEAIARIPPLVAKIGAAWLERHGAALVQAGDGKYTRGLASAAVSGRLVLPDMSDGWGVLCAARPDDAAAVLERLLRRTEYVPGAPAGERAALLARLEQELADLERAEEEAVDAAAAAGVVVTHRADVLRRRDADRERDRRARERAVDLAARQQILDESFDAATRRSQEVVAGRRARATRSAYVESGGARPEV